MNPSTPSAPDAPLYPVLPPGGLHDHPTEDPSLTDLQKIIDDSEGAPNPDNVRDLLNQALKSDKLDIW